MFGAIKFVVLVMFWGILYIFNIFIVLEHIPRNVVLYTLLHVLVFNSLRAIDITHIDPALEFPKILHPITFSLSIAL